MGVESASPPKGSLGCAMSVPKTKSAAVKGDDAENAGEGASGEVASASKSGDLPLPSSVTVSPHTGRVRRKRTTGHANVTKEQHHAKEEDTDAAHREPKGWTLKHVLSKATWGINLSKAFAPHINLSDPNRVKVGVRIRPLNEAEQKRGETKSSLKDAGYMKLAGTQIRITNPRPPPGQEAKVDNFAFDQLYPPETTTAQVFKDLAMPLVHLLCDGYNGTIFAYGQTGSGKTHSMMGNASDPGVTPRVASELFDVLKQVST